MASYRLNRVASTVREVVGDAILHRLNDPRISPLTSVTRVEVTRDLLYAKVYVSVMGAGSEKSKTMSGLEHSAHYIQSLLAKQLATRHCPKLRFVLDPSLQGAIETNRIIDRTMAELADRDQGADSAAEGESTDTEVERE
jgi:ribosome-binding factor A